MSLGAGGMPVVLGTRNPGKIREFQQFAVPLGVRLLSLDDSTLSKRAPVPHVAETGSTYADNAMLKARAYSQWAGMPCIADDTGLEIEALNRFPGVYTAIWGLPRVVSEMKPSTTSRARFVCSITYAGEGDRVIVVSSQLSGEVRFGENLPELPTMGLPFADFFYPDGEMLPLSSLVRSGYSSSHRAQAFQLLVSVLR